jgi:hypothetical protein
MPFYYTLRFSVGDSHYVEYRFSRITLTFIPALNISRIALSRPDLDLLQVLHALQNHELLAAVSAAFLKPVDFLFL